MFDALKKLFSSNSQQASSPFAYEEQWSVSVDDNIVRLVDDKGQKSEISLNELAAVAIKTYDSGPATDDVWWVLIGKSLDSPVSYPQRAKGEKLVLEWLLALPNFKHEEMIKAMGSTGNEVFIVWTWE